MRVLYSVSYDNNLNPFLKTLTDAIKRIDCDIHLGFGAELIWSDEVFHFDVLHIMWPEFLVDDRHSAYALKRRLSEIKKKGIHIVSTCHNIEPHYSCNKDKYNAIIYSYELSDTIHHLGNYSLSVLKKCFPNVDHELIPHHIYDTLYTNTPSRKESCRYLGLSPKYNYILCLGAIRDIEEIEMLEYVAKKLRRGTKLIVPSLILNIGKRFDFRTRFNYYKYKFVTTHNRLISNIGFVKDEIIPYYLAVSSITLVQRLRILNSGNVPLGMFAGNVIIGPNIGNVGEILKNTGNFFFNKKEDIPGLIELASVAVKEGKGDMNREYALSNWSSSFIAKCVLNSYKSLFV